MTIKTNLFEPRVLFSNKIHYFPHTENFTFASEVSEIKNTPVAPSFAKRFIHGVISLFYRLETYFLIKDIKNNKFSNVFDINKSNVIVNRVDSKIISLKKEIEVIEKESKNLHDSICLNLGSEQTYFKDDFAQDEINKKKIEIKEILDETRNKNIYSIRDIFFHANDKFDFYSFCDYLTEVKRAKDFFSAQDDIGKEGSDSKLIVEFLNEVIKNRINSLDDKSIKNILKLIFLKFKFENIHLNEKYDFMSNFSSIKKRDEFISCINFLVIAEVESNILLKFDKELHNEIKNYLSTIMNLVLENKKSENLSFESVSIDWANKYISNFKIDFNTEWDNEDVEPYKRDNLMENQSVETSIDSSIIGIDQCFTNDKLKSERYDFFEGELQEKNIIHLYEGRDSDFESYIENIKNRFDDILGELRRIDVEEESILKELTLSSEFYHNIDLYKNEINKIIKEINEISDDENKNNFKSIKDTLNDDLEIFNNSLKDIQVFNIEDKKSIINGLIKDLDKIIVSFKNDALDNELNKLSDIFKQNSKSSNIAAKPLFVNYESTLLTGSEDIDITSQLHENNEDELNVDELFSSLENSVNEISSDISDILDKFKSLSHNIGSGIETNSVLSKIRALKKKYINEENIVIDSKINNPSKNKLDEEYIKNTKKVKELLREIDLIKRKSVESKARYSKENQQADEIYISNSDIIKKESKSEEIIKINKESIDSNISENIEENTVNKPIKGNNDLIEKNIVANWTVDDDKYEGELRTVHSISIDNADKIEIKDNGIILIKDPDKKNKNIENVKININENRVTYLRVDYDNKKLAKSFKYVINDEIIKEIKDVISNLKINGVNNNGIKTKNEGSDPKINKLKEKIKSDIENIINEINRLSKKVDIKE
ncbi:hypothetical protein GY03_11670 [Proteus vulgaris]|uniref:hypothetical protein n=1 Tax=Proteus vulgaris TaxID=585 RepID=UPI0021B0AEB6|nr:hypothetical protein [Proteus vulgaris]MCT6517932.1 hypothetical protein [Proteus vulgaris]